MRKKSSFIILIAAIISVIACTKDPYLTLETPGISVGDSNSSKEVSFRCNRDWNAISSESWCTVSPESGKGGDISITITASSNNTYDARTCTVTINVESLIQTITVSQNRNGAIVISKREFDVSEKQQNVEVAVEENVDFDVCIPDNAADWVSYTGTKGLQSSTLLFALSENDGEVARTAVIKVCGTGDYNDITETVTINQAAHEPCTYWITAGTLSSSLNQSQKDTITTMVIKGEIDSTDFITLKKDIPNLKYLDLSMAKCKDDRIPDYAFGFYNYMEANGKINRIVLPSTVTTIGEYAFAYCSSLAGKLELPEGLTRIGKYSFYNCKGFTGSLSVPEKLCDIGEYAFAGCSGFTSLTMPDGLKALSRGIFSGCSGFSGKLEMPAGIKSVEDYAFNGCSGFSGILTIPSEVSSIGISSFGGCMGFTGSLNIPAGVTGLGEYAFAGCSSFTSLTIPRSVTIIGDNAFSGCTGFTGLLDIPDGVTTIGNNAFDGCGGFTSLELPENIKSIGNNAFEDCKGFAGTLTIPESVTSIGSAAFYNCSGFTALALPDGLASISNYLFSGCTGLTGTLKIPESVKSIGNASFVNCTGFTGTLVLPEGLTGIGYGAFYNCNGFTGVLDIPTGITGIGNYAFYLCGNITSFRFPQTSPLPYYSDMIPSGITIEVPLSAVDTYKETDGWKDHNIVGY